MRTVTLRALAAALALGGVVWTADALVVTDAERIAALADGLSGPLEDRRVASALAHVDLEREPVELVGPRGTERFQAGERDALDDRVWRALGPYLGATARLVQRSVEVRGDDAMLAVRVAVDGELADVQLRLRRHGEAWLVRRVRVL